MQPSLDGEDSPNSYGHESSLLNHYHYLNFPKLISTNHDHISCGGADPCGVEARFTIIQEFERVDDESPKQ